MTFLFDQAPNDPWWFILFLLPCLMTFYTQQPNAHLIVAKDIIISFNTRIISKDPKQDIVWDRDVLLSAAR
jgi:hypothetical protein